jgi:hypothetical protein
MGPDQQVFGDPTTNPRLWCTTCHAGSTHRACTNCNSDLLSNIVAAQPLPATTATPTMQQHAAQATNSSRTIQCKHSCYMNPLCRTPDNRNPYTRMRWKGAGHLCRQCQPLQQQRQALQQHPAPCTCLAYMRSPQQRALHRQLPAPLPQMDAPWAAAAAAPARLRTAVLPPALSSPAVNSTS